MSRLAKTFSDLHTRGEQALIAFVTAGDPLPERTAEVIAALADGGADIVEIGIPFSDPLADGPTIQAASQRALETGMTPPKVLEIVCTARENGVEIPIVLMGSWNPALQYGAEKFAQDAAAAGADGTIMTDLTPEEADDWKRISEQAALDTIFLLAPTSTEQRMQRVGQLSSGFLYCVSRTGITGAQNDVPPELSELVARIRRYAPGKPICVGFGIHRKEQVRKIAGFADGMAVGSAIVSLLHRERDNPDVLKVVRAYVQELKEGTLPA